MLLEEAPSAVKEPEQASPITATEATEATPSTNRGGNFGGRITEAPLRALVYLSTHRNKVLATAGGAALAGLATLGIVSAAKNGEPPTAENIKNIVDSYNQVHGGPPPPTK
jgi:hypothetical protein